MHAGGVARPVGATDKASVQHSPLDSDALVGPAVHATDPSIGAPQRESGPIVGTSDMAPAASQQEASCQVG